MRFRWYGKSQLCRRVARFGFVFEVVLDKTVRDKSHGDNFVYLKDEINAGLLVL